MSVTIHEPECMECGEENLEDGGYLTYERASAGDFILVCKDCYDAPENYEKYGLVYLEWSG